jgi:hypothetical protein
MVGQLGVEHGDLTPTDISDLSVMVGQLGEADLLYAL